MKDGRFACAGCCRLVICLVLWVGVAGCTLMTVEFPGEPLPKKELNIRVLTRDFAKQFVQSVEQTADRIMAEADDPAIQTNALRWKLNAVAELQDTVFQPIPSLALIDTWTFCIQMAAFFRLDQTPPLLGRWQPLALATADDLEAKAASLNRSVMSPTEFQRHQDFVNRIAVAMPVADLSFYRESVLAHWARFEGRSEEELVSTIGTAPEVLEDFINRFAFYEQTITKRAQWATKLYMVESGMEARIEAQMAALNANSASIVNSLSRVENRLIALADQSPELIGAAYERLNTDLTPMIDQLNARWTASLAVMDQINQRWDRTLGVIAMERQALIDRLTQERSAIMQQVDAVIERSWRHLKVTSAGLAAFIIVLALIVLGMPFGMGYVVGRVLTKKAA